uniref:Uncharacterized protein n=1 Tax=Hippocampus comes TaxID=109280 RepID=A0A3Q2Z5S2_HIPCM
MPLVWPFPFPLSCSPFPLPLEWPFPFPLSCSPFPLPLESSCPFPLSCSPFPLPLESSCPFPLSCSPFPLPQVQGKNFCHIKLLSIHKWGLFAFLFLVTLRWNIKFSSPPMGWSINEVSFLPYRLRPRKCRFSSPPMGWSINDVSYPADSVHANVRASRVARCPILNGGTVAVDKVVSLWHTVQLTGVLGCHGQISSLISRV